MCIAEFNNFYLQTLTEKVSIENKDIIFLGDFNINLLNYDSSNDVSDFLDSMCSYSLFPFITQPTRITPQSKSLIDNIFLNFYKPNLISGNLTFSLADHLIQFIAIPSRKFEKIHLKIHRRCFKNFNKKLFLEQLKVTDWDPVIQEENKNINNSTTNFLEIIKKLLDYHAPFKLTTKEKQKTLSKPWITSRIIKSIKIKNKIHKKFIKCKNQKLKLEYFQRFKSYRNQINNLIRYSKKLYYSKYFNETVNNLRNTWKGIKSIINLKSKNHNVLDNLTINNKNITDKKIIANTLNEYFSTIAEKFASNIIPPRNDFSYYLKNCNPTSFFISPVTPQEIIDYISMMNPKKGIGPNSIPSKILILASQELSYPLSVIINESFKSGIYPDSFKLAKVIPIFKNGSKQDHYQTLAN
ncbi:uncharacterized protein LOC136074468 [Hydra vulgaris]|uniref:Uncharacterized protein LOC136074468 n=1 Tax=Hydra vulgaris TaxID=6087 RepID=A0ABM4B248_HYDVU